MVYFHAVWPCVFSTDTMKARPLCLPWAPQGEVEGGWEHGCVLIAMKEGLRQVTLTWYIRTQELQRKQYIHIKLQVHSSTFFQSTFIFIWKSFQNVLKHIMPQHCCTLETSLWSRIFNSTAIQLQHSYVLTCGLKYCFALLDFPKHVFTLSTLRDLSCYQILARKDGDFPSVLLSLPPTYYHGPKYLVTYVVMLQLSTNLLLIKHIAFIINLFVWGNVLSLKTLGTCFLPCFLFANIPLTVPNGQCILRSDKSLIAHVCFSWYLWGGVIIPVVSLEEEDGWGYLVIINM